MALGRHVLVELSRCEGSLLADLDRVRSAMVEAAGVAGAEVREAVFHRFAPHGVSGVVVISESHLSIHTWPELGYAAIDVYTCGAHTEPLAACEFLASFFRSGGVTSTIVERGLRTPTGDYDHAIRTEHSLR